MRWLINSSKKHTDAHKQRHKHFFALLSFFFLSHTQAAGWVVAALTQVRLMLMCVLEWDDDVAPKDLRRNMVKLPCKCCVSAHGHVCVCACVWKCVCSVASSAFYPHALSKHNKHGWIHLSSFEAYDTSMCICCTLISLSQYTYQFYHHIILSVHCHGCYLYYVLFFTIFKYKICSFLHLVSSG